MKRRRFRDFGVVAVVLALVLGIVVVAAQAEGQTSVRAQTNDGGAWLVNGREGVIGHMNRGVGEITGVVSEVAESGDTLDTEQSGNNVVTINASTDTLDVIDPRTFQSVASIEMPDDVQIRLDGERVAVWTESPLRVWSAELSSLSQLDSLDELAPIVDDENDGVAQMTRFGSVLAVSPDSSLLYRLPPVGNGIVETIDLGDVGSEIEELSALGDDAILRTASGSVLAVRAGSVEITTLASMAGIVLLGQPGLADEPLNGIADDGTLFTLRTGDDVALSSGQIDGADPLPPLFHNGCTYIVTARPAALTTSCNGSVVSTSPLDGSGGASLRLRLVNGWVWVNDLATGATWTVNAEADLDRVDDWGAVLANREGDGDESDEIDGDNVEQRENPDGAEAVVIQADEIDEDGVNEPPVARPDTATTRTDLPVIVDVLRNDEDADGDVLLVTALTEAPEGTVIEPTGDRRAVQVTPRAGSNDPIDFSYTISDGRGATASAAVTVEVKSFDAPNEPPVAVTDAVTARAGASAALNVLDNDYDPDGDSLILTSVESPAGTVSFDGSGQVTFEPDPSSDRRTLLISYTVSDTLGATAVGTIRVAIRLADSNSEPDARNDSAVTAVNRPVSFNVLLNDTDPDDDSISVSGPPALLSSLDPDATIDYSLSSDGQMFFVTDQPGEHILQYSISDGSERDTALIRVDVDEAGANRAPIAIRDDVTIPRGGQATVYVLLNDSDPDGDVVVLADWAEPQFAAVQSLNDVALLVSVAGDAPDEIVFRYSITDGLSDPTSGVVVIAVTDTTAVDQAPVLRRDVIEVRPGGTTTARVLLNDFDPEGGVLRITDVSEVDGVSMRIGALRQEILVTVDADVDSGFTFTYEATDDGNLTAAEFVDVRLVPDGDANRPPVARPDSARTRSGVPVGIAVLNNDSDPDGDEIRLESIATQPGRGSSVVNADGTVTYAPDPDFRGTDRFQYVVIDELGDRAVGEVLVGVIAVSVENRAPTAISDQITVAAGSDSVRLSVLDNDFDPDGDALSILRISDGPAIQLSDDGSGIIFEPPVAIERDNVSVSFTYRISDGRGGEAEASVTVIVEQIVEPQGPIARNDLVGPVREGTELVIAVLDNDLDPDGRRSDLVVQSLDGAGVVTPDGSLRFTAQAESSVHEYSITDADSLSSTASVEILVTENVAPQISSLSLTTPFETSVDIDLGALISDADGDDLFVVCCDSTRSGSFEVLTSGPNEYTLRFTPDGGFSGQAGFAFEVDDQARHQVAGAVAIVVEPRQNTGPTASDLSVDVAAGTTGTIALRPVVDDVDLSTGDQLTIELIDATGIGITLTDDVVSVVAAIDAAGESRSFSYRVSDEAGLSADGIVVISIGESTAPPPLAVDDAASTTEGVAVTVDVVANDIDEWGDGLRVVAAGSSEGVGAITFDESGGTVTLAPSIGFFGSAQISYTIEDARRTDAGRSTGSIDIDVIGFPGTVPTPLANADSTTATITWGQPAANGAPIEEFEIESDQGNQVSIEPSSSHTFIDLANGVEIAFRVRARNQAGWGPWSGLSAGVTPDIQPGRPGAPNVSFRDLSLDVSWAEPDNDGSILTRYVLEIGGGTSDTIELPPNTTYTWPNLTNGVNYQFRVIAENASGPSDVSAWSTAEHPLREPDAPSAIDAQRGDEFLDLTWSAPANNGDPIIEYQIERESAPGAPVTTDSPSFRWANIPNGEFQRFRTRARNRDPDWSVWSVWSNSEKPCNVADAAAAPGVTRGNTQVALTWTAPADNGCSITGYTIEAVGTGLTRTAPPAATSLTFDTLANGTSYTFRIVATNDVGAGTPSPASATVIPAGPPLQPASFAAAPTTSSGGSSYSFTAPSNNGDTITSYRLRINGAGSEAASVDTSGTFPTGSRNGLSLNTGYYFAIQACNSVGCGSFSSDSGFTTFGPPNTPSGFTVSEVPWSIRWDWSSVPENGSTRRYEIERTGPGGVLPVESLGQSLSDPWTNGTFWNTYSSRVRACNALGCSPWSANRTGTVFPVVRFEAGWGDYAGCGNYCNYTRALGQFMRPNHNYFMRCFDSSGQFGSQMIGSDSIGSFFPNLTSCVYNTSGESVYVTATDEFGAVYTSNTFLWIP